MPLYHAFWSSSVRRTWLSVLAQLVPIWCSCGSVWGAWGGDGSSAQIPGYVWELPQGRGFLTQTLCNGIGEAVLFLWAAWGSCAACLCCVCMSNLRAGCVMLGNVYQLWTGCPLLPRPILLSLYNLSFSCRFCVICHTLIWSFPIGMCC